VYLGRLSPAWGSFSQGFPFHGSGNGLFQVSGYGPNQSSGYAVLVTVLSKAPILLCWERSFFKALVTICWLRSFLSLWLRSFLRLWLRSVPQLVILSYISVNVSLLHIKILVQYFQDKKAPEASLCAVLLNQSKYNKIIIFAA
jgi:hypothetical protein